MSIVFYFNQGSIMTNTTTNNNISKSINTLLFNMVQAGRTAQILSHKHSEIIAHFKATCGEPLSVENSVWTFKSPKGQKFQVELYTNNRKLSGGKLSFL